MITKRGFILRGSCFCEKDATTEKRLSCLNKKFYFEKKDIVNTGLGQML